MMTKEIVELKINPEYEKLIPEISKQDFEELKKSIETNGLYDPITINNQGIILDGHHRYKAWNSLGKQDVIEHRIKDFESPLKEKRFVIESNLRRRHLEMHQKAALALELKKIEVEEARIEQLSKLKQFKDKPKEEIRPFVSHDTNGKKKSSKTKSKKPRAKSNKPRNHKLERENRSTQKAAEKAQMSGETLSRYESVLEHGSLDLIDRMTKGLTPINAAFSELKKEEKAREIEQIIVPQTDREICDKLGIALRPYDAHWNFSLDGRFNVEYPGKIPAGILFGCLYFFTKQGDLVIDPMAGSGAMGKVCEVFKRRCLMYDINPFNNEIKQYDILKGLPQECKGAELLFWDPPYYKKLVEEYGPNSISAMSRSDFLKVFEDIALDAQEKDIKKIALLVSNYDDVYYSTPSESVSIHDYVEAIREKSDWCWYREIQCPLTTEQVDPKRYDVYLENKKLFGLGRSLIIFKREEYRDI